MRLIGGIVVMTFTQGCQTARQESLFDGSVGCPESANAPIALDAISSLGFTALDTVDVVHSSSFVVLWDAELGLEPTTWAPTLTPGAAAEVTQASPSGQTLDAWCPATFVRTNIASAVSVDADFSTDLLGAILRKGSNADDVRIALSGSASLSDELVAIAQPMYQDELDRGGVLREHHVWVDGDLVGGDVHVMAFIDEPDGTLHGSGTPLRGTYEVVTTLSP